MDKQTGKHPNSGTALKQNKLSSHESTRSQYEKAVHLQLYSILEQAKL